MIWKRRRRRMKMKRMKTMLLWGLLGWGRMRNNDVKK
jgi:hypothetical protein